jgi:hypothetical protein
MVISAHILQQAIGLYLEHAYPGGNAPVATLGRISAILELDSGAFVPESCLEKDNSASFGGFSLRLGQPNYPHMKLIIEPVPVGGAGGGGMVGSDILLRVDTHDRHLHAAPGSPDAAWLASIRTSNRVLTDQIESAWAKAGLPTFKEYLRQQLQARRAQRSGE